MEGELGVPRDLRMNPIDEDDHSEYYGENAGGGTMRSEGGGGPYNEDIEDLMICSFSRLGDKVRQHRSSRGIFSRSRVHRPHH